MKAKLIIYELAKLDQYHKVLVNRALFGFIDNSNKGSYKYQRKGVLSGIPHMRLIRGVIVVKAENSNRIISILNNFNVKPKVFDVSIKQSMLH